MVPFKFFSNCEKYGIPNFDQIFDVVNRLHYQVCMFENISNNVFCSNLGMFLIRRVSDSRTQKHYILHNNETHIVADSNIHYTRVTILFSPNNCQNFLLDINKSNDGTSGGSLNNEPIFTNQQITDLVTRFNFVHI